MNNLVNYRPAQPTDIPQAINLIKGVFGRMGGEGWMLKLGDKCLVDIFCSLLYQEPEGFIVAESNRIVGFIVGVRDAKKTRVILPKLFIKTVLGRYNFELGLGQLIRRMPEYLGFLFSPRKSYARAELSYLVIDEGFQGQGVGTKLALLFFEFLKRKGVCAVQVLVNERNIKANKFYNRLGFEFVASLSKKTSLKTGIMVKQL